MYGRLCETWDVILSAFARGDSGWQGLPGGFPMDGLVQIAEMRRPYSDAALERFALQVVAQIADRPMIETGKPGEKLLSLLLRHARSGDPALLGGMFDLMRRQRMPAERVVDVYLPAAARRLGNAWHEGELDILATTVAISRLQAILRELSRAWRADHAAEAGGDTRVLLAVPEREKHTLGALIATQQLRRMGVSVNLQLLISPARAAALAGSGGYDAVFISMANRSNLETCRYLVKSIKRVLPDRVPVVLGGPLAGDENALRGIAGVDLVTSNVMEALVACGLIAYEQAAQ